MMKKRLLALLMAAVMTISLLPTTAWAHDAAHAEGIRDTEGVEDVQGSEGDRDLEEVSDSENVPGEDAVDAAALAAVEDDGPAALAAATTLDSYFEGLPVIAETEPGSPSSTKKWKVTTLGGDTVLMSGNKGKSSSTSTLQLTFTGDTHLTFEYKVSSEKNYDKCTITLGSDKLVNGADLTLIRLNITKWKNPDDVLTASPQDTNGNGVFSVADIVLLTQYLLGKDVTLKSYTS